MGVENLDSSQEDIQEASQPESSGQASAMPARLRHSDIKSELVANGGKLKRKMYPALVRQLRQDMQERKADTDAWLKILLTMEGWDRPHLLGLLLDCDIIDSPTEPRISLLRAACPHYLHTLLHAVDTVDSLPMLMEQLFTKKDDADKTAIEELIDGEHFSALESVFDRLRAHNLFHLLQGAFLASVFKGKGVARMAAFARIKPQAPYAPRFHEIVGMQNLLALDASARLQVIEPLLQKTADSDGMALYQFYMAQPGPHDPAFSDAVFALQRKQFDGPLRIRIRQTFIEGDTSIICSYASVFGLQFAEQFLKNRNFKTDPLAHAFLKSCTTTELAEISRRLSDRDNKQRNDFSSIFADSDNSQLFEYARHLSLINEPSLYFHLQIGVERLLALPPRDVLELVNLLLGGNANSHGINLYTWYNTTKPDAVDADFCKAVCAKQRELFGSFASQSGVAFLHEYLFEAKHIDSLSGQKFIQHLDVAELVRLAEYWLSSEFKLDNSLMRALRTVLQTRADVLPTLLERVSPQLVTQDRSYFAMWSRLCLEAAPKPVLPAVITHLRRQSGDCTTASGLQLLRDIHRAVPADFISIWNALQPDEMAAIPRNDLLSFLAVIPKNTLPFALIKDALYTSQYDHYTVTGARIWHSPPRPGINRFSGVSSDMGYFVNGLRKLKMSINLTTNGQRRGMLALVSGLLEYRKERDACPLNRYRFLGIEGGYTKQQKLGVVDKFLTHIYGTENEKAAVGAFSQLELDILNQGNLRSMWQFHRYSLNLVITQAHNYATPSAIYNN